jgi:hypothetical protein
MSLLKSRFLRRANADGTTDSICCKCYVTVATANHESELAWPEHRHVCDPLLLKHWQEIAEGKPSEDFMHARRYRFCCSVGS